MDELDNVEAIMNDIASKLIQADIQRLETEIKELSTRIVEEHLSSTPYPSANRGMSVLGPHPSAASHRDVPEPSGRCLSVDTGERPVPTSRRCQLSTSACHLDVPESSELQLSAIASERPVPTPRRTRPLTTSASYHDEPGSKGNLSSARADDNVPDDAPGPIEDQYGRQLPTDDKGHNNDGPGQCGHLESSTSTSELAKLAELLSQRQDNLPRMEPEVFKGELLQYPIWVKSFETIIEGRVSSPSQRLFYLNKYTTGEAKEAIQGFLTLGSADAYQDARDLLKERYGNEFIIAEAYKRRINEWPPIKYGDGRELRKFADFLTSCMAAMENVRYLRGLNDVDENRKMVKKLPKNIAERWSRKVDAALYRTADPAPDHKADHRTGDHPTFKDFCQFMTQEARVACNPINDRSLEDPNRDGHSKGKYQKSSKARALASTTENSEKGDAHPDQTKKTMPQQKQVPKPVPAKRNLVCSNCKGPHLIVKCEEFLKMPLAERQAMVKTKSLCWGCLRYGHKKQECRNKLECEVCKQSHPTPLHRFTVNSVTSPDSAKATVHSSATGKPEMCIHSLILPVYIYDGGTPDRSLKIYALLDPQSDSCFVTEDVAEQLAVDGPTVSLRLSTMLAEDIIESKRIAGLRIKNLDETVDINLPGTYSRHSIPASHDLIPRQETVERWPHLRDVSRKLPPYDESIEIGLLIGTNCAQVLKPREVVPGQGNQPYAIRTDLGWGVIGIVSEEGQESEEQDKSHFTMKTHVKEVTPQQVREMFQMEYNESGSEEKWSVEDRRFMAKVRDGIYQREDGRFVLPLPLKDDSLQLPENRQLAVNRLNNLKHKMIKNPQFRKDYTTFMQDMLDKGYAERVPATSADNKGQVWYLPHHGVYHPQKPGKIRVVYDCSAEYKGEVLNRHLLQGPDLTNNLCGVLIRFRREPIAFTCDIQAMFYQVVVEEKHRDLLRFLWWEDGRLDTEPVDYRMTRHIFGATSSPGCANFALREAANRYEGHFGKATADFIRRDFYVDDGAHSDVSTQGATVLIKNSGKLCEQAGFHLHKYICNNKEVVNQIPSALRAQNIQSFNPHRDLLPVERILGIRWCVESDTLQFSVDLKERPLTRRGILATVSSVFDPLGLVAPVILEGKRIIQELCRDGQGWDDPIPEEIKRRWQEWQSQLHDLTNLKVPRCYRSHVATQEPRSMELHHFSDASLRGGYGQCSYLRRIERDGAISTALVMAKSRVGPSKPLTVPRLELTAAVSSVKMSKFLRGELDLLQPGRVVKEFFWTDSMVVLGYISNEAKRFHIFVANRVQQIRDSTSPRQWHHVGTKDNPADLASRGTSAKELLENDLWWKGPAFLLSDEPLPIEPDMPEKKACLSADDPEVRKSTVCMESHVAPVGEESILEKFAEFSSWFKLQRAVAVCNKFIRKLRNHDKGHYSPVTVDDMEESKIQIIKIVQRNAFAAEIKTLSHEDPAKRSLTSKSNVFPLDPFLDDNNLLRVGGRIKGAANLADEVKHPILLPGNCHVSRLIIGHHHRVVSHSGRGITLNSLRQAGLWIIKARSAVATFIKGCITCRKLRGNTCGQKMADLPSDRLDSEAVAPFTYSAVDYFGPFVIKEGRKELKRWGVLFTCMASRSIHIETANSLDTDAFLNAYRRFVCRRGPVRLLRCDHGSNFIGGRNELKMALAEMDKDKLKRELLKDGCEFINFQMNFPHSSHMGGVWERMIGAARNALSALLINHGTKLDDELLRTLLIEAEAIVNSRPLTYVDMGSPDSLEPISPSQLLTLKSKVVMPPPGIFERTDLYCRRRWRRVQALANEFWARWRTEFLPTLQERKKWNHQQVNLAEDDVVLMVDESTTRSHWPLARVVETFPGDDGLVRKVKIRTSKGTYERPIHKLVLLLKPEERGD